MTVDGSEMTLMAGTTTVDALTYIQLLLLQFRTMGQSRRIEQVSYIKLTTYHPRVVV